jgi:uncharacterized membrane protein YbhN (UPF0104 family)
MKKPKKSARRPHSNKRTILELFGLLILIIFTISQRTTLQLAINEIRESDFLFIAIASLLYWVMLPLTAVSFRILSDKRLNIWTTTLAQLAGSGPGRIIPGGLGRLSLSVVHLIKLGFKSSQSIVINLTSNIIGVLVNMIVLSVILFFEPSITSLFESNNYAVPSLSGLVIVMLLAVCVFQWLLHSRKTRKVMLQLLSKARSQLRVLKQSPVIVAQLAGIALLILTGYVIILLFSSYALHTHIDFTDALIALSVGVLIGGVLPTPGGIGGVEAGIASTLVLLGYGPAESTSIALLFRAITYWQPLIPGTFAYLYLRKRKLL